MSATAKKVKQNPAYRGFRQVMSGVHTWMGLIPGWILYFMFITGTAGYFNTEITTWMEPERPFFAEAAPREEMVRLADQRLREKAPNAHEWYIGLPDIRSDHIYIGWEGELSETEKSELNEEEQEERLEQLGGEEILDPKTGQVVSVEPRETGGGTSLYLMHYILHYMPENLAEYLVLLCSMLMLVGLITGVVIHKKIFKDFFTLRLKKGQRSWLDAHNLLSILTLPFQVMITYSGLLFFTATLTPILFYFPIAFVGIDVEDALQANAIEDLSPKNQAIVQIISEEFFGQAKQVEETGIEIPLAPLDSIFAKFQTQYPEKMVTYVDVHHVGDSGATIALYPSRGVNRNGGGVVTYNGATGEVIADSIQERSDSVFRNINGVVGGLHEGRFAPITLRWIYFLSGLMGAGMVATGCILWAVKRRRSFEAEQSRVQKAALKQGNTESVAEQKIPFGTRFVEAINTGVIAGLLTAVAAYFWANRLLPITIEGRADLELDVMFIVWGAMLCHAAIRPRAQVWSEQLLIGAFAFGLIPALNLITTERHLGVSLFQGDWVMAGFDLTMLALGTTLYWAMKKSQKTAQSQPQNIQKGKVIGATI